MIRVFARAAYAYGIVLTTYMLLTTGTQIITAAVSGALIGIGSSLLERKQ